MVPNLVQDLPREISGPCRVRKVERRGSAESCPAGSSSGSAHRCFAQTQTITPLNRLHRPTPNHSLSHSPSHTVARLPSLSLITLPGLNGTTHYIGLPIIVSTYDIYIHDPDTVRKLTRSHPFIDPFIRPYHNYPLGTPILWSVASKRAFNFIPDRLVELIRNIIMDGYVP